MEKHGFPPLPPQGQALRGNDESRAFNLQRSVLSPEYSVCKLGAGWHIARRLLGATAKEVVFHLAF
jgi:hypothetical protein